MTTLGLFPDGDHTLEVAGEIDMLCAAELDAALDPLVDAGGTVVLDLRRVTFMDSTGLRSILRAATRLKQRGMVVLRDPQPIVVRLLEVTGLMPAPDGIPLQVRFDGHKADGSDAAVAGERPRSPTRPGRSARGPRAPLAGPARGRH